MLNFFRRSKTKDNIEYTKNDTQKEKFKQLSSLDDTTIVQTASTSSVDDKNKSGKVAPRHESGKQHTPQRSATLTSLTPPRTTLLNGDGVGNVICKSPPSATIIQQPKDRRIIGHKPYVANICDLVYLTNENQQQKQEQNKKISGAFKDIMAPAMGWRNKNKNNNSKKGKNNKSNVNTHAHTSSSIATSSSSNSSNATIVKQQDMGNNNTSGVSDNQNKSENTTTKQEQQQPIKTVQHQENKIKNNVQLNNNSEPKKNVTKSQASDEQTTSSLERPIKPPRVEKTNSILRTSQEHNNNHNTNSGTSLQQQPPDYIAIIGSTANDLKHQSSNANVLQSNANKSITLNADTTEIFLPVENNLIKIDSKVFHKQNSCEKKSPNVPKVINTEKSNEKVNNATVKIIAPLKDDKQSIKMGNQQTTEPNKVINSSEVNKTAPAPNKSNMVNQQTIPSLPQNKVQPTKNVQNTPTVNKVETVPNKNVQKTSNLEQHSSAQNAVKEEIKVSTNSSIETKTMEQKSTPQSEDKVQSKTIDTPKQNGLKIEKVPVQNLTNQTQINSAIKPSAQNINDKTNINDHTLNKINNDNKQNELLGKSVTTAAPHPQLQKTKSVESNDSVTPPLVCSIAIPLPAKILKSDKIPVTSVIERTLSTDKSIETNEGQQKIHEETDKTKNLVSQEARFQSQIAELKKQLSNRDAEALKFTCEMEELQRDVYVKSCGMDRLEAELISANKESEHVRKRIRHLEDDLQVFRDKNSELAEEITKKSDELNELKELNEKQASELAEQVKTLTEKIEALELQNEEFKKERDRLEQQRSTLEKEREEEKKIVQEALEMAMVEKKSIQERWEKDFEKLRTVNTGREQQLLDDFEWKLREVEQSCKRRIEEKEKLHAEKLKEAYKDVEEKMKIAEGQLNEVLHLKSYEAEVKQLRGLTDDQQKSLRLMSQRTEELQLSEETLKEEIEKLKTQIEIEKGKMVNVQHQHQYELTEKDRELQIKLEAQIGEVAVQWEERLHQECSRLKSELEQLHGEEKMFAVEAIKNKMNSEHNQAKKSWEHQLEECTQEIQKLKQEIKSKEENYQTELERLQTKNDRDIMELRRSLDKTDMTYNNKIEKLTENHEREIERLTDEYEKKIKDLEANWQMQIASTRTTLELVKEQMERDTQNKLQSLDQHHRSQLEHQWDQLVQDKEEALQQMEQNYRGNCDKLKDDIANLQKSHTEKQNELLATIDELKTQIEDKTSQINCLQSNVDTLQGGMHVLNREIKNHEDELSKMQKDNEKKVRRVRDELLAEQTRRVNHQKEQHTLEMDKFKKTTKDYIDNLQKKCQCWSKLFEEMRTKYQQNQPQENQAKVIADLKQVISRQEIELKKLMEEKNNYKVQLGQKIPKEYRRKGGGGVAIPNSSTSADLDKSTEHSQILTTPNRELDIIWEANDNNEEPHNKSVQESK